ncbi:MAG: GNAT family N-acetyltransferase [bacterium]
MDSSITIRFFDKITDEKIANTIWNILCECDNEFYPPLSERKIYGGLLEINCRARNSEKKPYLYYKSMIKQRFLVAFMDNRYIVGFMSFLSNVRPKEFNTNCNYYTTLCVRPANRHKGIATQFLMSRLPEGFRSKITLTRTWSLNYPIIKSLSKAGFTLKKVSANDRDRGIDTLYYQKQIDF